MRLLEDSNAVKVLKALEEASHAPSGTEQYMGSEYVVLDGGDMKDFLYNDGSDEGFVRLSNKIDDYNAYYEFRDLTQNGKGFELYKLGDNGKPIETIHQGELRTTEDILWEYYLDVAEKYGNDLGFNMKEVVDSYLEDYPEDKDKYDELLSIAKKLDRNNFNQAMQLYGKDSYIDEFGEDAYNEFYNRAYDRNITNESVTIDTGSTIVTSDESGVTVEDNGNTITAGNGVTVNVNNAGDELPAEMDIASPVEELSIDEPVEELPAEEEIPVEEPTEEPVEELPEDDLDESTVNEEVLEKKDDETEEEVNNSKVEECDKSDKKGKDKIEEAEDIKSIEKQLATQKKLIKDYQYEMNGADYQEHIKKIKELEDKLSKLKLKEADGYDQNQNVEIYQNPEFDYQILDITELDNIDNGDVRAIDMANILNDLDESLTEAYGNPDYVRINSFLTRKGTHKKTNESYSSAILELVLPKLNESVKEYKNVFFLEVYGDKPLKECIVRDSSNHIIKQYSGKAKDPVKHFEGVILDIDRARQLNEEISQAAYSIADGIANEFKGKKLITWNEFRDKLEEFAQEYDSSLIDDEHLTDFEADVRSVLSMYYGLNTIYEGENEGGLTTKEPTNEAIEFMVNEPFEDGGINFADGKAIEKDEKRQENHLKQNDKIVKGKKFKVEKEPDQENTAGKTEEEATDTAKVEKLPKAKKTKVDAKKLKVKEIKEGFDFSNYSDDELVDEYVKANRAIDDLANGDFGTNLLNFITSDNGGAAKIKAIQREVEKRGIDWDEFIDKFIAKDRGSLNESNCADQIWQASTMMGGIGRKRLIDAAKKSSNAEEFKENMLSYGQAEIFNMMSPDDLERLYNKAKEAAMNESTKLKVKEIKEDVSIRGVEDDGSNYSFDKKITKPYYTLVIEHNSGDISNAIEFDTLDKAKSWVNDNKNTEVYDYEICDGKTNECIEYINESTKLKEAVDEELLDEPIVTDGSEPEDELEESGSDVAIFHRKPASVDAMRAAEQNGITVNKSNYKIVGTKELPGSEFEQFANHLSSEEYDWLKDYNDTSNSGEFKCVEVINTDDNSYSILVDPQGYNYARYAAIKDNLDDEELLEPEEELIDETNEEEIENE